MRRLSSVLLGMVLGATVLWGVVGHRPAAAQGKAPVAAPAWEYQTFNGSPNPSEFNKLGSQGWELVLMIPGESYHKHHYVFKRLKP